MIILQIRTGTNDRWIIANQIIEKSYPVDGRGHKKKTKNRMTEKNDEGTTTTSVIITVHKPKRECGFQIKQSKKMILLLIIINGANQSQPTGNHEPRTIRRRTYGTMRTYFETKQKRSYVNTHYHHTSRLYHPRSVILQVRLISSRTINNWRRNISRGIPYKRQ